MNKKSRKIKKIIIKSLENRYKSPKSSINHE